MIVKDEESVIERCLASVKGVIDYWVIIDTGSLDQKQWVIQNFMQHIPGELHQSKWINFEHNRNEALNLSRDKGDYLLFIDADEVLVFDEGFKWPLLDKDCYSAIVQESKEISYQSPLLIKSSLDWNWSGVLHEALRQKNMKLSKELSIILIQKMESALAIRTNITEMLKSLRKLFPKILKTADIGSI